MQFVLVLGLIPSTTKYVENTKAHPTTEMSNVFYKLLASCIISPLAPKQWTETSNTVSRNKPFSVSRLLHLFAVVAGAD